MAGKRMRGAKTARTRVPNELAGQHGIESARDDQTRSSILLLTGPISGPSSRVSRRLERKKARKAGEKPVTNKIQLRRTPTEEFDLHCKARQTVQSIAIQHRRITDLIPNPRNARAHSPQQIGLLAASIKRFGFATPVVVDENAMILAGHGRIAAAKLLGMDTVPVIALKHLTKTLKRGFALADNRIAELAHWDDDLLRIELRELCEIDQQGGLEFELETIGFDTAEVDRRTQPTLCAPDPADDLSKLPLPVRAVSRRGDIWLMDRHRLICGDARDHVDYAALLRGELAQLVFTDPPYNVAIQGNVTTKKHREFVEASGEMSRPQYTEFLRSSISLMARHSEDGTIAYLCIDWRHTPELGDAARPICGEPRNLCVWAKTNAGLGTLYRSQHEFVVVYKFGNKPHVNNFGLGERGRYRTNLWQYAGANAFGAGRDEASASHPTVKPVAMVADAILDCSRRNWLVLDPFAGSGTTLIAAERTGRRARLMELDPRYCDVIVRRWQQHTGKLAYRAADEQSFDQLADQSADTSGCTA